MKFGDLFPFTCLGLLLTVTWLRLCEGLLIKNMQLWLLRYQKDQQVPGKKLQFLAHLWVRSLVDGDTGRSNLCCWIELSWSPRFRAEFNDWLLAFRMIRIIGLRSSIPCYLFMKGNS